MSSVTEPAAEPFQDIARVPMRLHLIGHPDSDRAETLINRVADIFSDEPLSGGLRMPIRRTPAIKGGFPPDLDGPDAVQWDNAHHTLVVAFLDSFTNMGGSDGPRAAWDMYLKDALERFPPGESDHALIIVALDGQGLDTANRLGGLLSVDATGPLDEDLVEHVALHLSIHAVQLLQTGRVDHKGEDRKAPVTFFLSHIKRDLDPKGDGTPLSGSKAFADGPLAQINSFLGRYPAGTWFDRSNIPLSQLIGEQINTAFKDVTAFVALHTDNYSESRWCQEEMRLAADNQMPILIVDALDTAEKWRFLRISNAPCVRWRDDLSADLNARRVVRSALRETLRYLYWERRTQSLARGRSGAQAIGFPPDGHTVLRAMRDNVREIFYPDPPLSRQETVALTGEPRDVLPSPKVPAVPEAVADGEQWRLPGLFRRLFGTAPHAPGSVVAGSLPEPLRLSTPMTALLEQFWDTSVNGSIICVSVSGSAAEERYGMTGSDLEKALDEVCLYGMLAGARIGYGGAITGAALDNETNFTHRLWRLVQDYRDFHKQIWNEPLQPIVNYAPWPLVKTYTTADMHLLGDWAEMERPGRPDEIGQSDEDLFGGNLFNMGDPRIRAAWGAGLTRMYAYTTDKAQARFAMGGKLRGFLGLAPGVVSEIWTSIQAGKPVFLVGTYGGAVRAVIDMLEGRDREEFKADNARAALWRSDADADKNDPDRTAFDAALEAHQALVGRPFATTMIDVGVGLKGLRGRDPGAVLNNGLSGSENRELFYTDDPARMAYLVMKGLAAIGG